MHPNREQLRNHLLGLEAASRQLRTEIQAHPECPNLSQTEIPLVHALGTPNLLIVNACFNMLPIQA